MDSSRAESASTFRVRVASLDDVEAILAISNESVRISAANFAIEPESLESWRAAWRNTHEYHPWLVAVDDLGAVIGFAKASPWRPRAAYAWSVEVTVYVRPGSRRRGVGRALYTRLFEILRAQGYHTAVAGITQPNEASVRLHESFGMRQVGMLNEIGWKFGAWHGVGYWSMLLQTPGTPAGVIRPVADVFA